MLRELVSINEDLCNGCGLCVPACHEGALQVIDGKARLISDLMCDGLGSCLGHCPEDAISIEMTDTGPYNETVVMKNMIRKGEKTVIAHLEHLASHGRKEYVEEGMNCLRENLHNADFDVDKVIDKLTLRHAASAVPSGCPGSRPVAFIPEDNVLEKEEEDYSALQQWPVQMHLINPAAPYFKDADLLLVADCVAYAHGNFHSKWLTGKKLIIACPKLDHGQEIYRAKLEALITRAGIRSLTVLTMEVPCCSGLVRMAADTITGAGKKVPLTSVVISIRGKTLEKNTFQ